MTANFRCCGRAASIVPVQLSARWLVSGRNSRKSQAIQAPLETRPGHGGWETERRFGTWTLNSILKQSGLKK